MEGLKYSWFVNGTFFSNDANTKLTIGANFDSAVIKLIVSSYDSLCGSDSVSFVIKIPAKTVANKEICEGESLTFNAPNFASKILWLGNKTNLNEDTLQINYTDTITLSYSIKWCNYEDTFSVVVNPLPVFNLPDSFFCERDSLLIVAPIQGIYKWNNTSLNSNTFLCKDSGRFYLKITDNKLCHFTDTFFISQKPSPALFSFPFSDSICSNSIKVLQAPYSLPNLVYSWNNGEHFGTSFNALPNNTHSLMITNKDGCSASDSIFIPSILVPESGLAKQFNACDKIVIKANKYNNATYQWNKTQGIDSFEVNQTSTVELIIEHDSKCKTIDTAFVEIYALPIFDLGNDTAICKDDSMILFAPENMNSYLWNNTFTENRFTAKPPQKVVLEVSNIWGCFYSDSMTIDSIHCDPLGLLAVESHSSIRIFPNPASNVINFEFLSEENIPHKIEIISVLGNIVRTIDVTEKNTQFSIDVTEIPNGLYSIHLQMNKHDFNVYKIIIVN